MTKSKRVLLILVTIVLILILGAYFFYWIKVIHPLNVFRTQEANSIQQFDALNNAVLSELPDPPAGVELISSGTAGILSPTNVHGRKLRLEYSVDANIVFDEILMSYQSELEQNGWHGLPSYRGDRSVIYYRDSSCVEIIIISLVRKYYVEIWHDFQSQSFSPTLPPSWLLSMHDYYETDVLTCPPK
jgi:hypothetical protein